MWKTGGWSESWVVGCPCKGDSLDMSVVVVRLPTDMEYE